jgi:hypothetical protein
MSTHLEKKISTDENYFSQKYQATYNPCTPVPQNIYIPLFPVHNTFIRIMRCTKNFVLWKVPTNPLPWLSFTLESHVESILRKWSLVRPILNERRKKIMNQQRKRKKMEARQGTKIKKPFLRESTLVYGSCHKND